MESNLLAAMRFRKAMYSFSERRLFRSVSATARLMVHIRGCVVGGSPEAGLGIALAGTGFGVVRAGDALPEFNVAGCCPPAGSAVATAEGILVFVDDADVDVEMDVDAASNAAGAAWHMSSKLLPCAGSAGSVPGLAPDMSICPLEAVACDSYKFLRDSGRFAYVVAP